MKKKKMDILHEPGNETVTSEFSFDVLLCSYKWHVPSALLYTQSQVFRLPVEKFK